MAKLGGGGVVGAVVRCQYHIMLFVVRFWSHCLSDPVVCVKVLVTLPIRSCCLC